MNTSNIVSGKSIPQGNIIPPVVRVPQATVLANKNCTTTYSFPKFEKVTARYDKELVIEGKAWEQLYYYAHHAVTEVGAFGISKSPTELLHIIDVEVLQQRCTLASVDFDDDDVCDFLDRQDDKHISPVECHRIWIHTHPDMCPMPSTTDEDTFQTAFFDVEKADWAIMMIVSGNCAYARIRFNVGPIAQLIVPVRVVNPYIATDNDFKLWDQIYAEKVTPVVISYTKYSGKYSRYTSQLDSMYSQEELEAWGAWDDEVDKNKRIYHQESQSWGYDSSYMEQQQNMSEAAEILRETYPQYTAGLKDIEVLEMFGFDESSDAYDVMSACCNLELL